MGRHRLLVLGLFVPLFLVFATMGWSGLWDPYELNAADLARRAAIHLFHAPLEMPGAENRMPTLGDVGHLDLPVVASAASFKLFGLHAWAGRLPFALAGALSLCAAWAFVRRAASERAAALAVLAVVTTPLFFVQARSMMGDAFTQLGFLAAVGGLLMLVFDDELDARGSLAWGATAVLGLVTASWTRGGLFGLALPCLSVVLAAAVVAGNGARVPRGRALGVLVLAAGVGMFALHHALADRATATPKALSFWLGSAVVVGGKPPTFDVTLRELAHGLFPWSALVPLCLVRLAASGAPSREADLRLGLSVVLVSAFATHTWAQPFVGSVPFVAAPLLACACAFVFHDLDRREHTSRALPVAVLLLLGVLALDLRREPIRSLVPFGVPLATFPEAFRLEARPWFAIAAVAAGLPFALALFDRHDHRETRTLAEELADVRNALADAWGGNLTFVAVMLEAMLVGFAALVLAKKLVGLRVALTEGMSEGALALLLHACWAVPLAIVLAIVAVSLARRATTAVVAATGLSRGSLALGAFVLGGLVMSLGYHPALGKQISPKEALAAYDRARRPGERLGLLSVAGRGVAYYGAFEATPFADPQLAFNWLMEGDGRRFLALRAEDLPRLSSLYRGGAAENPAVTQDHNLPVLHASGYAFLASNVLAPTDVNRSPYVGVFRSEPPTISHPTTAVLENQLEALGWDLADDRGRPARSVVPGRTYKLSIHVRVLAPLGTQWKAFVHVDGAGKRWNGDHDVLEGKVPMSLWKPGDVVTDTLDLSLEPNFTPGVYTLYYGFFLGERRMQVRTGKHHENRVDGGPIEVR